MKHLYLISSILFVLCACSKQDYIPTDFEQSYTGKVTIDEATDAQIPVAILSDNIISDLQQVFRDNNADINNVTSFEPSTVILSIEPNSGMDFGFLKQAELYLLSEDQPPVAIAELLEFDYTGQSLVSLKVKDDLQLFQHLLEDYIQFRLEFVSYIDFAQELDVNVEASFVISSSLVD